MACDQGQLCDKDQGLPILLVRYAVSPESANAPKLGASFKAPPIPLGEKAHYALRLLRQGYVYVYNPADPDEPWRGYMVTPQGYLYPFPGRIGKDGPEELPEYKNGVPDPCNPRLKGATAQCITIPYAEKAGDIWIGFSDVEWTKKVWKSFDGDKNEDNRNKVMRKFNVAGWLDKPQADHAGLAKDMDEHVVEFTESVKAKEFAFSSTPLVGRGWNSVNWLELSKVLNVKPPADPLQPNTDEMNSLIHTWTWRSPGEKRTPSEISTLLRNAQVANWPFLVLVMNRLSADHAKTKEKGLVLALDDAVGITSDLSTLVSHASKRFYEQIVLHNPDLYRGFVTSQNIQAVHEMYCNNAIRDEQKDRIDLKARLIRGLLLIPGGQYVAYKIATDQGFHDLFTLSPNTYKQLADEAWKDYEEFYDPNKITKLKQEYTDSLSSYNESEIAHLSKAHAEWLGGTDLANTMLFHFDVANVASGRAYAGAVAACIGSGQETFEVREVIKKWVEGDVADIKNLYLRALVFNQEVFAKEVAQFTRLINGKPFKQQLPLWKDFLGVHTG